LNTYDARAIKIGLAGRNRFIFDQHAIPYTKVLSKIGPGNYQVGNVKLYATVDNFPNRRFPYQAYVNLQPDDVYLELRYSGI
jgi:hypothetical protein